MNTICAVSTPLAEGGLAVIRISGSDAIAVADRIFIPFGGKRARDMDGYTCAYGKIADPNDGHTVDDVMLTIFRAPHSYTGEDTAEISCHGGIYLTKKILRICLDCGCRLADRGEFTKRAFLNGKLSLTQAESVMDIISAQGESALRSARLTREGRLFREISQVRQSIVAMLGSLAAWVDYPEEDLPEVSSENLLSGITAAETALEKLLARYDCGMLLKSGVDTVIAGKPNVGKSTLMNLLLGYDRSIVSEVAGTTRDVVQESVRLGELVLRLSDTAGIRVSDDTVEKIGVDLARKRINDCALVIAVFDGSLPLDEEDTQLLEYVNSLGKNLIAVINKSDKGQAVTEDQLEKYTGYIASVSAANGEGAEEIERLCRKIFSLENYDADSDVFANERQKKCAENALAYLKAAKNSVALGDTLDAVTVILDRAADSLLELTGEKTSDAVIDEVFSKFCVGK